MKNQPKFKIIFFASLLLLVLRLKLATIVSAHCPLCIAGAGAGLTLSRLLGIDDAITGVWMGAFLGAIAFWTDTALAKKRKIPFSKPLIYIAIFATSIWSFYKFNLVVRMVQIFGLDKLTFGMVSGGVLFYLVDIFDDLMIKKNGRVFFPYQRIAVSLGSMLILSLAIFYLINYVI